MNDHDNIAVVLTGCKQWSRNKWSYHGNIPSDSTCVAFMDFSLFTVASCTERCKRWINFCASSPEMQAKIAPTRPKRGSKSWLWAPIELFQSHFQAFRSLPRHEAPSPPARDAPPIGSSASPPAAAAPRCARPRAPRPRALLAAHPAACVGPWASRPGADKSRGRSGSLSFSTWFGGKAHPPRGPRHNENSPLPPV